MKFRIINLLFTFLLLCNYQSSQCQMLSDTTVTFKKSPTSVTKVIVKNQAPTFMPSVTDIDGNQYKTVKIGTQVWMAENLNVSHFRNGDSIHTVDYSPITPIGWSDLSREQTPAWGYFWEGANVHTYGKLYNWYAVNDKRGLAPKGWHIPTDAEWNILINYLGGINAAVSKLKATKGWMDMTEIKGNNGNGTNESGFSALPGGARAYTGREDIPNMTIGSWWSTTPFIHNPMDADHVTLSWDRPLELGASDKGDGLSVRCVKD